MVCTPITPQAAWANGSRLLSWSCGQWSLAMTSIVPSRSAVDHGPPVLLGAQRRRDLGEGAVALDLELVQREVMRGGVAGHAQAAGLGGADRGSSAPAVETWAKCSRPPVSSSRRRSRSTMIASAAGRDPGEAQPRGERTLVHHAVLGQGRLLRVLDDQRVEAGGVGQRAAHHPGVGQRPLAVGERHRARGLEQADLGQLLAAPAAW